MIEHFVICGSLFTDKSKYKHNWDKIVSEHERLKQELERAKLEIAVLKTKLGEEVIEQD